MMDLVQEQYNLISDFYELFYSGSDLDQVGKDFLREHDEFFGALSKHAKICDCSCGNGFHSITLKKAGYDVLATDISDEMVHLTLKNAKENGVEFPVNRLSWQQLAQHYDSLFDIVLCWGNSISHSLSREDMVSNLKSIRHTLRNKGKLLIETRNWDKIIKNKQRYFNYEIREYQGKKYLPFYIMNVKNFDEKSDLEMIFVEIKKNLKTECTAFRLDFVPFRHTDFLSRIHDVGFNVIKDTYSADEDFYHLVLEK